MRRRPLPGHCGKVIGALLSCGTAQLGGHQYLCEECGTEHFVPHSCRNRHCPRCQRHLAEAWLCREKEALLPIPYFHLVFTLPHALHPLIRQNQRALYRLLFASASESLLEFGRRRFHGQIGVTAVLHTWGQNLSEHYHLHCLVTAGALSDDRERFRTGSARYLFAVRALSRVFQAKFRDGLWRLHRDGALQFHGMLRPLAEPKHFAVLMRRVLASPWIVYAKRPFAGAKQVLAYLSRYTHRVAMGRSRIMALDEAAKRVTFRYKDYADDHREKTMTLATTEFLRRFCLHILPPRFVKIRHYGLFSNQGRKARLLSARVALTGQRPEVVRAGDAVSEEAAVIADRPIAALPPGSPRCPQCGSSRLKLIGHILPRTRLDSS
jgi:hypothetical protein